MVTGKFLFLAAATLSGALLFSPAKLKAATQSCGCPPKAATTTDVATELAQFKSKAFQVQREAGVLKSFTPNSRMHWQSHTAYLGALKHHVNDMGQTLARLEGMRPLANESQQIAIDNARPHLAAIADRIGRAISLINENRSSVKWSPYNEIVADLSQHTGLLYEKLDTILGYASAQARLEKLELGPRSGS